MIVPCIVTSARYCSCDICPPLTNGSVALGHTRWKRISSESTMSTTTAVSASRKYWMPMTLWSTLKIYFRMKPLGSAIGACTVDPPACACELMRGLLGIGSGSLDGSSNESWTRSLARRLLLEECVVIRVRDHVQITVHARMAQAAELRANHFVLSNHGRREVQRNHHAGQGILLDAQFAHVKIVDYVLRADQQVDFAVHWNCERGNYDVVFSCGIIRVNSQRIAGGSVLPPRRCGPSVPSREKERWGRWSRRLPACCCRA